MILKIGKQILAIWEALWSTFSIFNLSSSIFCHFLCKIHVDLLKTPQGFLHYWALIRMSGTTWLKRFLLEVPSLSFSPSFSGERETPSSWTFYPVFDLLYFTSSLSACNCHVNPSISFSGRYQTAVELLQYGSEVCGDESGQNWASAGWDPITSTAHNSLVIVILKITISCRIIS